MKKIIGYLLMCPLVVVIVGALYETVVVQIGIQPNVLYNVVVNFIVAVLVLLSFVIGEAIVTEKRDENDEMKEE